MTEEEIDLMIEEVLSTMIEVECNDVNRFAKFLHDSEIPFYCADRLINSFDEYTNKRNVDWIFQRSNEMWNLQTAIFNFHNEMFNL